MRALPVCPTKFHVRTYIRASEFQSSSELLIPENCLPLTDEVTVDLVLLFATITPLFLLLSKKIRLDVSSESSA